MREHLAAIAAAILAASVAPPLDAQTIDLARTRLVDLTHAFDSSTVYWPTAPSPFVLERLAFGQTPRGYFY